MVECIVLTDLEMHGIVMDLQIDLEMASCQTIMIITLLWHELNQGEVKKIMGILQEILKSKEIVNPKLMIQIFNVQSTELM
jgi:hypothetical protein